MSGPIVSFIWSMADDCLRDVFVRGKYRDVILPMFVFRRIDCLLEETKEAVLAEVKFQKVEAAMALFDPEGSIRSRAAIYLYGKEVNPETYAISSPASEKLIPLSMGRISGRRISG